MHFSLRVLLALVFIAFLNALGACILILIDEPFSFGEAYYLLAMTSSTVGYGDVHPETVAGRWFLVFYQLLTIFIFMVSIRTIPG